MFKEKFKLNSNDILKKVRRAHAFVDSDVLKNNLLTASY